jgi:hypothetical protein
MSCPLLSPSCPLILISFEHGYVSRVGTLKPNFVDKNCDAPARGILCPSSAVKLVLLITSYPKNNESAWAEILRTYL